VPISFRSLQPCNRCERPLRLCELYRKTFQAEAERMSEIEVFAEARGPIVEITFDCACYAPRRRTRNLPTDVEP